MPRRQNNRTARGIVEVRGITAIHKCASSGPPAGPFRQKFITMYYIPLKKNSELFGFLKKRNACHALFLIILNHILWVVKLEGHLSHYQKNCWRKAKRLHGCVGAISPTT